MAARRACTRARGVCTNARRTCTRARRVCTRARGRPACAGLPLNRPRYFADARNQPFDLRARGVAGAAGADEPFGAELELVDDGGGVEVAVRDEEAARG